MESRELSKKKFFCECFVEKCMEWLEFIRYGLIKRDTWISNLIEYYYIHKEHMEKNFVKEFLKEREKILGNNSYKMVIVETDEPAEKNIIGKVMLFRKKQYIHQAILKTKDGGKEGLIFWSFEKENDKV